MAYNTTTLFEANNIAGIYSALNTMTHDFMTVLFLVVIFAIAYFNINSNTANRRFMGASLITTFIGGLFFFGGYLNVYFAGLSPLLFLVTIVIEAFD